MKKVLVIGGSGFIGSELIKKLSNYHVINFDKNNSKLFSDITIIGNILDLKNHKSIFKNIDVVVLLAAEHADNVSPVSLYYDVNVKGTKNVLKYMDKYNVNNLVFTSSVAIYGFNKINCNEEEMPKPFNHYGKSKLKAEEIINKWYLNNPKQKSVNIIRPSAIFGERMKKTNIYNFIDQIYRRRFLLIGNSNNIKSIGYVDNLISFINFLIKNNSKSYNIYNYSDQPDLSVKNLAIFISNELKLKIPKLKIPYFLALFLSYCIDIFSILFNKKFKISSVRIKKFCSNSHFNSSKVHRLFKPKYSLNEGLSRTIKYIFK